MLVKSVNLFAYFKFIYYLSHINKKDIVMTKEELSRVMNNEAIKAYNKAIDKQLRERVGKLLSDNKMPYEYTVDSRGYIEITVENGDWKHDHIRLKNLMRENGFILFGRHIPDEETGDDSFSAVYLYR